MNEKFEIVALKKGGYSLRCLLRQETFHPGVGPVAEAMHLHVRQHKLVETARNKRKIIVWDVGLGAAANALAVIEALLPFDNEVVIVSFDRTLEALEFALKEKDFLEYPKTREALLRDFLRSGCLMVRPGMKWIFRQGDFIETMDDAPLPTSILFDPYSPYTNTDIWSLDTAAKLRNLLAREKVTMSNYTRSTAARVTWLLAGFYVGVGWSIGEKAETSMVSTDLALLEKPLAPDWLSKIPHSRNSAPFRGLEYQDRKISEEDWLKLQRHPQFTDSLNH